MTDRGTKVDAYGLTEKTSVGRHTARDSADGIEEQQFVAVSRQIVPKQDIRRSAREVLGLNVEEEK